jgi:hypothetical protein
MITVTTSVMPMWRLAMTNSNRNRWRRQTCNNTAMLDATGPSPVPLLPSFRQTDECAARDRVCGVRAFSLGRKHFC